MTNFLLGNTTTTILTQVSSASGIAGGIAGSTVNTTLKDWPVMGEAESGTKNVINKPLVDREKNFRHIIYVTPPSKSNRLGAP